MRAKKFMTSTQQNETQKSGYIQRLIGVETMMRFVHKLTTVAIESLEFWSFQWFSMKMNLIIFSLKYKALIGTGENKVIRIVNFYLLSSSNPNKSSVNKRLVTHMGVSSDLRLLHRKKILWNIINPNKFWNQCTNVHYTHNM